MSHGYQEERKNMGITILGLGPGDASLLTLEARKILEDAEEIYLRTSRHPTVASLPPHLRLHSFDCLYESEGEFSTIYEKIAAEIIQLGQRPEGVIYAVPGHPLVGEETVQRILALSKNQDCEVRIVPGLSFIEAALTSLGIDPLAGLQIVDATILTERFHPNLDPDLPALVGQLYSRRVGSEVKLTLMNLYPAEHEVTLLRHLGTPEAVTETILLHELDHVKDIDHLTTLYVPPLPKASSVSTFHDIVARLRAPGGCPWDREQTHQTLRPHLLEETYEVLQAIDEEDDDALREELGDLMLQIILHAQIAVEEGSFTLAQVLETIIEKIIRRHPHVFAGLEVADADEVLRNWQAIKREEKGEKEDELLWGMPLSLPALTLARRAQERAKREELLSTSKDDLLSEAQDGLAQLDEMQDEEEAAEALGRLLFTLTNLARHLGVDAESALRTATVRFGEEVASSRRSAQLSDGQPGPTR
ncbi:MAG TPA: nucleoside triphosphate pyrophosphohydrolase [Anaerolineae bacterium]|nr:nucleoside triphosphate pyrophosphohydrolase [Anaerolineae bacterium]